MKISRSVKETFPIINQELIQELIARHWMLEKALKMIRDFEIKPSHPKILDVSCFNVECNECVGGCGGDLTYHSQELH